ncbi:hypothetical protein GCM10009716_46470 [Streptomyces sodiiphilus]|uniref:Uncharacterized protein n=1 Tax=Streptomyces sodiiphilus TaxID=226217 RepID=A0ABN2PW99_9ACTN
MAVSDASSSGGIIRAPRRGPGPVAFGRRSRTRVPGSLTANGLRRPAGRYQDLTAEQHVPGV